MALAVWGEISKDVCVGIKKLALPVTSILVEEIPFRSRTGSSEGWNVMSLMPDLGTKDIKVWKVDAFFKWNAFAEASVLTVKGLSQLFAAAPSAAWTPSIRSPSLLAVTTHDRPPVDLVLY